MLIALIANPQKESMPAVAARLVNAVRAAGSDVVADAALATVLKGVCTFSDKLDECDAAIALGGDGTVLQAVHRVGFAGVPLCGINLGTLGFLAEVPVEEMEIAIDEIIGGAMVSEARTFLVADSGTPPAQMALNEIVIDKRGASRMIQIDIDVDGMYLNTYIADGIIVATPTGSTAYSLSAGGPIVAPASRDFVITPLAPHALTARPLIVPDSSKITITARSDRGTIVLSADGIDTPLASSARIEIRRADTSVTFLRRPGVSNYDVLRAKLLWGKDARGEASKKMFRQK